jgi:hypothetical protein
MALQFSPTAPGDLEAVSSLMLSAFKAEHNAPFVDRKLLRWKYFESGPPWEGSRGYVLKVGENIAAHCGVWPINLSFRYQHVTCNCFVDWVSDKSLPGAGFLLKRKLLTMAQTAIVVGGTDDTRAVVPKLGFQLVGEVGFFVRIVRPWKQFRTRPSAGLSKDAARLVRNTMWSKTSVGVIPTSWSAIPLESFDQFVACGGQAEHPTPWRNPSYFDYWLRVPTVEISGYAIQKEGKTIGYFLLSRVGGQTRIADIRLCSTKQDEWNTAYSLAAHAAAQDPQTCEIMAVASTLFSEIALLTAGFHQRGSAPFFLYDPKGTLASAPPIFWNLIDGDAAYIQDPDNPYTA